MALKDKKKPAAKPAFTYKKPDREVMKNRQNQSAGLYDSLYVKDVPEFKPKEGDFLVRFLPNTWAPGEHYGYDMYVHFGVGPDTQSYLCLAKNKHPGDEESHPCPICEAIAEYEKAGRGDEVRDCRVSKRVLAWVIDRDNEKDGPKLWQMPFTVDKEIAKIAENKRTGEFYAIDSPEDGYDIQFSREGTGFKTKYGGYQRDSEATPLTDDEDRQNEWLQFVVENPIPGLLKFEEYDYLKGVMEGTVKRKGDDEESEEDEKPTRSESRRRARSSVPEEEEVEEEPVRKRRPVKEEAAEEEAEEPEEEETPAPRRRLKSKASEEEEEVDTDEEPDEEPDEEAEEEEVEEEEEAPRSPSKLRERMKERMKGKK